MDRKKTPVDALVLPGADARESVLPAVGTEDGLGGIGPNEIAAVGVEQHTAKVVTKPPYVFGMPYLRADEAPTQAEREKMAQHLFGDPENKKYPLDTDKHVNAAGSYLEAEHNAGRMGDAKYHEILARVNAAKKTRGIGEVAEKSDAADRVQRWDLSTGKIEKRSKTPSGGLAITGNLARVGVQRYRLPDGTVRREYRPPEEVFSPDSLASFHGAPLTEDHPGRVDPANWKRHTVGHVAAPGERDGRFVRDTLHVQHGATIHKADTGELRELSCGYECRIDPTSGITPDGEPFDVIQRDIRVNHVALGPEGWGRAGRDVRMHLDGGVSEDEEAPAYVCDNSATESATESTMPMTEEEKKAFDKAVADAKVAAGERDAARQDAANTKAELEKVKTDAASTKADLGTLNAKFAMIDVQAKRQTEDASRRATVAEMERAIDETISIRADAKEILGRSAKDPSGKEWKHDGKSNAQLQREMIGKLEPDFKFDAIDSIPEGEGPDKGRARQAALDGVYALAVRQYRRTRDAHEDLLETVTKPRADGARGGDVEGGESAQNAFEAMKKRKVDAWKSTPSRLDRARGRRADVGNTPGMTVKEKGYA